MIIRVFKTKAHQTGISEFFCPNCMTDTRCHHMRVSRCFTLCGIPLFSAGTPGQYVRCGQCQTEYSQGAVKWTREKLLQALEPWGCTTCGNRNPRSYASCIACGSHHGAPALPLPQLTPVLPSA
jgi:hypothetical protein